MPCLVYLSDHTVAVSADFQTRLPGPQPALPYYVILPAPYFLWASILSVIQMLRDLQFRVFVRIKELIYRKRLGLCLAQSKH